MESVEVLGNSLSSWITAASVAAGTFLLLLLVQRLIVHRLGARSGQTVTVVDNFFVEVVRRTRPSLLLFMVLQGASLFLALPPRITGTLRTLAILAVLLQVTLWLLVAIDFWATQARVRRLATDAASVTLVSAAGFIGKATVWSLLALLALDNLGINVTTVVAGLGVGGIAIGLALQNILGDLFASVSIVLDKPFVVGESIQVGEFTGHVERIGLKTTHVRSVNGELVIFPNGDLLQSRIRNQSRMAGERRVVLCFGVACGTPAEKVAALPEILRGIIEPLDQIRFGRAHFKSFGESSLDFEAVYHVLSPDMALYMDRQQEIGLALLRRLAEEGIELAFPTRTVVIAGGNPRAGIP